MQKKEKIKNKMLKPVKKVKKKNITKDAVPDNKLPNIQTLTFPSQMCTWSIGMLLGDTFATGLQIVVCFSETFPEYVTKSHWHTKTC